MTYDELERQYFSEKNENTRTKIWLEMVKVLEAERNADKKNHWQW